MKIVLSLVVCLFIIGCATLSIRPEIKSCRSVCNEFCANCEKVLTVCEKDFTACMCNNCPDGFPRWTSIKRVNTKPVNE